MNLQQIDDSIILGDINITWNKEDNIGKESLLEIMDLYKIKQHVLIKTHKQGNTLDWIILKNNSTTILRIQEGDYLSDHCTITWTHRVEKLQMQKINPTSRNLKSINDQNFAFDLAEKLSTKQHRQLTDLV